MNGKRLYTKSSFNNHSSVLQMEAEMKIVLIATLLVGAFTQLGFSQIQTAKVTG
jgi:hypothetical protein